MRTQTLVVMEKIEQRTDSPHMLITRLVLLSNGDVHEEKSNSHDGIGRTSFGWNLVDKGTEMDRNDFIKWATKSGYCLASDQKVDL